MSEPAEIKDARGILQTLGADVLRVAAMNAETIDDTDAAPQKHKPQRANLISLPDSTAMSDQIEEELGRVTGFDDGCPPPKNVLPVPAGGITFSVAGDIIFRAFAEKRTMFIRESVVHEIRCGSTDTLQPVEANRFCSVIEKLGKRVARREMDATTGKLKWRKCNFPLGAANVLLATEEARTLLPSIRQLANCPILTTTGEILTRGYHSFAGGTLISSGDMPPEVPLDRAVKALIDILKDFNFATPADLSRAVASLISPALKMGGHIIDDFPLDLAEADQSQSGKTYRQKLVARLYNENPSAIVPPRGGVGSLDESVAKALIQGRPFIALDNVRGRIDSGILESAIRGHGRVTCRVPYMTPAEVDTSTFLWQLSTNGAELTRDLANRSIITRIRKQPDGYLFREYLEGDLLAHVQERHSAFMGAIMAVVRAWMDAGCPKTSESRHDFRGWVRPLDWIVQNIFSLAPLLEGHRAVQDRTCNPSLQWLRDVVHAVSSAKMTGRELTTTELCSIAEDAGIDFPGNPSNREEPHQRAGKLLGPLFRDTKGEPISVDGFSVARRVFTTWENNGKAQRNYTIYSIP